MILFRRRKQSLLTDHRGASLLIVIVAFLFLVTLGTIVASAAVKNIEMKMVDKKSKKAFYLAQAALDEIKSGLTQTVSEEITRAYDASLEEYSSTNAAMRNALFQSVFTDGMKSILNVQLDLTTNTYFINRTFLLDYLKETRKNPTTGIGADIISDAVWEVSDGQYIVLKNVSVEYQNGDYSSKITTDIKIVFPDASFENLNGYLETTPFIKYALIAEDSIWAETSSHNITGSVYAGSNGIHVSSQENALSIMDGKIISAGDITVKDKAKFIAGGTGCEVWASNLVTTQTDKTAEPGQETIININGTCYMKDDLVVDAGNSNIDLTGQYYGYSGGDTSSDLTSDHNSAITVNAANSTLKLDGLSKLYLAGRAFINLSSSQVTYNADTAYEVGDQANTNILTGESLSVKGSQEAYLLPSRYIDVGHNPVSWEEYTLYYNSGKSLVNIPGDSVIFNSPSISAQESKLSYYLNSSEPYKKVFYKFGSNANMVYYYLNFETDKKATLYLNNYKKCYTDVLYNGFPIKNIKLNKASGAVVSAGNLITYENKNFQIMNGNNGDYSNQYATQYHNLSHTLQKYTDSTDSLFHNIINSDLIRSDAPSGGEALLVDDVNYVSIVNGDFTLDAPGKSGIIIATGDVTVNQSFTGMILAGGKIRLYSGANITAAPTVVSSIINGNANVKKYFVELNKPEKDIKSWKTMQVNDLISYENWSKN